MSRIGPLVFGGSSGGEGGSWSPPTIRVVTADAETQEGDLGNVVVHTGAGDQVHTLDHSLATAYTVVNGTDQPLIFEPTGGRTISGGADYTLPPRVGATRPGIVLVYEPDTTDWFIVATVGFRGDGVTIQDESGEFVTELFAVVQGALDSGTDDDAVEGDWVVGGTPSPDAGVTPGVPKMIPIASLGGGGSGLLSTWTVSDVAANPGAFLLPGKRYTAPGSNGIDFGRLTVHPTGFVDGETTVVWGQYWDWEAAWDIEGGDPEPFPTNNTHLSLLQIAGVTSLVCNGVLLWPVPWEAEYVIVPDDQTVIVGDAVARFRMPIDLLLNTGPGGLAASCTVESSSGDVVVDLNHNGSSILTDLVTIDEDFRTSVPSVAPVIIADRAQLKDAEMTVDVTSAGTGVKGLRLLLRGVRNPPV